MSSEENETLQHHVRFDGKLLILGCGSVAQCTIPLLLRHIEMPTGRVTVMDMRDNRGLIASSLGRGVSYVQERLTKRKFREQLARGIRSDLWPITGPLQSAFARTLTNGLLRSGHIDRSVVTARDGLAVRTNWTADRYQKTLVC